MMLNLLISPLAEKDLEKIFIYTFETWGLQQAERYQDSLYYGMQDLVNYPEIGKKYICHALTYNFFPIGKHLVFYREEIRKLIIIRVLHYKMEPNNHF